MRNEIETKRNRTKRNEIKQNETKPNETKRNVTSFRFAWFRFVSIGFVSFHLISFRSVSFLFRFALYRYPTYCDFLCYLHTVHESRYIYILWLLVLPTYMLSKNISCDFLSARVKNIDCDFLSCDFLTCDFLSVYRFNYHKSLMQIIVFHGSTWNFNKINIWFSYISSNKWDIIYTIHKW